MLQRRHHYGGVRPTRALLTVPPWLDPVIGLNDDSESLFPRVLSKVGFSQRCAKVLDGVHQRLVRAMPLAVLVYIEEARLPARLISEDGNPSSDKYQNSDDRCLGRTGVYRVDPDNQPGAQASAIDTLRHDPPAGRVLLMLAGAQSVRAVEEYGSGGNETVRVPL